MDNKDISLYEYKYDDLYILDKLKKFLNDKDVRKYVALVPSYLELIEKPMEELDLTNETAQAIELKVMDKTTGEAILARNLVGLARINAMFPTRKEQMNTGIKPYCPELVLYERDYLKAILTHLPLGMKNLNWGVNFVVQFLFYFHRRDTNREVKALNDKTYAIVHPVQYKKTHVSASAQYVSKIISDAGIKTPMYEGYIYWSNQIVKNGNMNVVNNIKIGD